MTPQEAINRIKNHIEIHSRKEPHFAIRILEALQMAIEALDYRVSKKTMSRQYVPNGTLVYGRCPICYYFTKNDFKYCGNCGQALDWSDTK